MSFSPNNGVKPDLQSSDRLLREPVVLDKIGVSRVTLWRLVKGGNFPKKIKIGRSTLYSENAVNQWIEDLKAEAES